MTIEFDPGLILFSVIFSISGASCCITLGYFLYKKYFKKNDDKLEVEIKTFDDHTNSNPYSKL